MVLVRVQYDAYNRRFELLDRDFAAKLEDGVSYLLIADLAASEVRPAQTREIQAVLVPVAH